jgi:hypothetical protein
MRGCELSTGEGFTTKGTKVHEAKPGYSDQRLKTRAPLVPPKPKELESA